MKRKITSLLLALVMTLALAVPAFASNYIEMGDPKSDATQSMTFNARTRVPVLSLSLPTLADNPVVFNPYQIKYDGTAVDTDTLNGQNVGDSIDQTKQIISPVYAIRNLSDTQLTVGVKAETTAEGIILGASVTDQTKKQAAIKVKFLTTLKETTEANVITAASTEQNIDAIATALATATKKGNVAELTLDTKKAAEIKVADKKLNLEATVGGEDNTKANYLLFQFAGEAALNPTEAWTSADKFSTVLTFTFQPGVATLASTGNFQLSAPADVTLDLPGGSLLTGTPDTTTPAYAIPTTVTGVSISNAGVITITKEAIAAKTPAVGNEPAFDVTVTYTNSAGATQSQSFIIAVPVIA